MKGWEVNLTAFSRAIQRCTGATAGPGNCTFAETTLEIGPVITSAIMRWRWRRPAHPSVAPNSRSGNA